MYISIDPSLNPFFWLALGLAGSILSAQLAFAWIELVPHGAGPLSTGTRLVGASTSIATGMWIAHATSVAVAFSGTYLAYDATYMAAFFVAALVISALSLQWSERVRNGVAQWRLASVATGAATVTAHILTLAAQRSIPTGPSLLLLLSLAIILCAGGFFGAAHLVKTYNGGQRSFLAVIRTIAAAIWGVTVLASFHAATISFTGSHPLSPTVEHSWPLSLCGPISTTALLLLLRLLLQLHLRTHAARLLESRRRGEQAAIDPLTKLANRHLFEDTIAEVTQQADTESAASALLVVGIDGAKGINQTFGYSEGDAVICEVSRRLRMLAKPQMVGRLSGDQFLLLIPSVSDKAAVSFFAGKVAAAMAKPFAVAGRSTTVTVSIGIAMFPQHGSASSLISHAESAMAQVKAAGGASHAFFDSRMIDQERERADLLRDLRAALDQRELQLYYQPKILASTGEVTGVEALIRWNHPRRGMVSPDDFIPLAERYGVINQIGEWVLDEACRQAREWRDAGMRMKVAINISAAQLRQADLAELLRGALEFHQIKPELITVEITESAAMDNTSSTLHVLGQLDAIGVHISIDDFGTGHSSLSYLRRLPADELKIDRSFVLDLETSDDARKVASAVINLAKALQLKVVAEGVETEGQNAILRRFGCDQLQGYLFGKPMPASALADWAMRDSGPRSLGFSDSLFQPSDILGLDPLTPPPQGDQSPSSKRG